MIVLSIPPKHKVTVHVTFEAYFENAVSIVDLSSGKKFKDFNNYFGGGGTWDSPVNNSGYVQLIGVGGAHKAGPPDGSRPWLTSPSKLLYQDPKHTVVGFEDSSDGDYNDAIANATLLIVEGASGPEQTVAVGHLEESKSPSLEEIGFPG